MWYGLAIGTVLYSRYLEVVTETSYPLNSISPLLLTISPWQTPFYPVSMSLTVLAFSYNRNHAGIVLLWIISCGIMSSWFIYVVVFDRIFFLWSHSFLLYIHATFSLSVHPLMTMNVVSNSWLLWIMLLWTWECTFLLEILISVLLEIYPEVHC